MVWRDDDDEVSFFVAVGWVLGGEVRGWYYWYYYFAVCPEVYVG